MSKDQIKDLIYLLISIVLGILAVKFIIWLLPVILVVAISYYLYRKMSRLREIQNKKDAYTSNNYTNNNKNQNNKQNKKEIKIIDMEEK